MTTDADSVNDALPSQDGRIAHLARESDALMTAIHEIHDMESEKRTVDISTPHFHELADKILGTSREVFRHAGAEADVDDGIATTDVTINQVAGGGRRRT